MKRLIATILSFLFITGLCSCNTESHSSGNPDDAEQSYIHMPCSKENVDQFMATELAQSFKGVGLLEGYTLDKDQCFNVTPQAVAYETDYQIFKFSDQSASFIMIGDEAYTVCQWFGGHGFVNAIPWDFDNDGTKDLLVASSWGSGLHRSIISLFNCATKESTIIFDTAETDHPQIDLIVRAVTPSFSSRQPSDYPTYYEVCSATVTMNDDNSADLSYVCTGVLGSVSVENGELVFIPTSIS